MFGFRADENDRLSVSEEEEQQQEEQQQEEPAAPIGQSTIVFIVLLVFVILAVAIVALGSQLRPRRPLQRESTLKSRSNQIATCFNALRLRFLFWHKTSQEVVHDSFPSTEIVAANGATFLATRAGSRPRLAI